MVTKCLLILIATLKFNTFSYTRWIKLLLQNHRLTSRHSLYQHFPCKAPFSGLYGATWSRNSGKRKRRGSRPVRQRTRESLGRHGTSGSVTSGTGQRAYRRRDGGREEASGPPRMILTRGRDGVRASERRGWAAGELYNMNAPDRGAVSAGYNQFWLQSSIAARSTGPIAEKKVRASNYRAAHGTTARSRDRGEPATRVY